MDTIDDDLRETSPKEDFEWVVSDLVRKLREGELESPPPYTTDDGLRGLRVTYFPDKGNG